MILGIEGSPRKNGNSHKLLAAVMEGAGQSGAETLPVHLRDYRFESCVGCEKCRKDKICTRHNDGMTLLYPFIKEAKGLALISPVHNYNVTAWVKAFIDRLYCFYEFDENRPRGWSSRLAGQDRKAVIAIIGEQEGDEDMGFAMEAMRRPLDALGYEIAAEIEVRAVFDRGAVAKREVVMERARAAGRELASALT